MQKRKLSLYTDNDLKRIADNPQKSEDCRSVFRRDYARILHSPSFRRLQGKTQLFPNAETDFFRNRLTHSLEVAQIATSIALSINQKYDLAQEFGQEVDLDCINCACLCHDLGHPPFGHTGEKILDEMMLEHGGFEGNAQTLRIISKIEKKAAADNRFEKPISGNKDFRLGLNLSYRTLASVLKYDQMIPQKRGEHEKLVKGCYTAEKELIEKIKEHVVGEKKFKHFKTIECQIMDVADDIAYSVYDLEDAFKAKFLNFNDFAHRILKNDADGKNPFRQRLTEKVNAQLKKDNYSLVHEKKVLEYCSKIFIKGVRGYYGGSLDRDFENLPVEEALLFSTNLTTDYSTLINENGYYRLELSSAFVHKYISGVELEINEEYPSQSKVRLNRQARIDVEIVKNYVYLNLIESPEFKVVARRGTDIVEHLFKTFNKYPDLMPKDWYILYQAHSKNESEKRRVVCDYISGFTDRYAVEVYGRLTSEFPQSIFKPF